MSELFKTDIKKSLADAIERGDSYKDIIVYLISVATTVAHLKYPESENYRDFLIEAVDCSIEDLEEIELDD